MNKKIVLKDKELILLCAFRYALGRKSYVVSYIVEEIINNWEYFHRSKKLQFKQEIKDYKELYGNLGMNCDEAEWNKILKL